MAKHEFAAVAKPTWHWEFPVAGALLLLLTGLIWEVKMIRADQQFGDTAMLMQLMDNLSSHGTAVGQLIAAVVDEATSGIPSMTAAQLAKSPLLPSGPALVNHFQFHFYAVLYLLAPFVRVFGSKAVLFAVFAASFTGMLMLAYVGLRRAGTPILTALAFDAAIVLHPAWPQGLDWQFYPDRIFLTAGLAFMVANSLQPAGRITKISLAALCASIDERAAITAGLFLIAHVVLYWTKSDRRNRIFDLGIAVVLIAYGVILVKFFLPADFYNTTFLPPSLHNLIDRFSLPGFLADTLIFLTVNAGFLILGLFEWRAAAIALFLMLPNIVGNIGGAEKVGWGTHYHDEYLPAVVWAGMSGLIALQVRIGGDRRFLGAPLAAAGLVSLLLFFIDPATGRLALRHTPLNFFAEFPAEYRGFTSQPGRATQAWADEIGVVVPKGVTVTAIEGAMPFLYSDRTIEYYPIDIDRADYAAIGRLADGSFNGAVSFRGPQEEMRMNAVLSERLRTDGYDLKHPIFVAPNGLVVLKRFPSQTNSDDRLRFGSRSGRNQP